MKTKTFELTFDGSYNTISDLPTKHYGMSIYNENTDAFYIKLDSTSPEMPIPAKGVYYQKTLDQDKEAYVNEGVQIKGTAGETVVLEVTLSNAQVGA